MLRWSLSAALLLLFGCQASTTDPMPSEPLAFSSYSGIYDRPVTLSDGLYQGEPFVVGGASRPEVRLLAGQRWDLDLDADGVTETLVLLSESSGGSGTFVYLAVMQPAGSGYRNLDTVLLGDRLQVARLGLQESVLEIQIRDRRSGVTVMDPDRVATRWWQFTAGRLIELQPFAGLLTIGHEVREFARCAEPDAPLWVSDGTQGVLTDTVQGLAAHPYQPLFVTFLGRISTAPDAGFAEPFTQQVRIVQLRRAEAEGHGCNLDLGGASFRAMGVEPFWSLDVFADRLHFRALGEEPRIFHRQSSAADDSADLISFGARDSDGSSVQLQLRREACRDTMSGNRYVWRAQLTLADRQLAGCALTGLPDQ